MNLPLIVIGGGGHAKVLIDVLLLNSMTVLGITDPNLTKDKKSILGVPVIGDDDFVLRYSPGNIELVNGLGSIGSTDNRKRLYKYFKDKGYNFAKVLHPSVVLSPHSETGEGVQIMAGAIIQVGSKIGVNSLINTRASIDHDCIIGNHVHIAPGVSLSGGVVVGDDVHIGTGATVIQGIRIGPNSIIGAGALVNKDVSQGMTVMGVPARVV